MEDIKKIHEVIAKIDALIEDATKKIESTLPKHDKAWYRGFRAGLSAAKEIIEKSNNSKEADAK